MVAGMEPTRINAHLTLREYRGGIRYGTDALLLASFVRGGRRARCADLGTGCGVIPLLLLVSGRCGEARGFEVQAEYAALAAENARDNGLDGRFAVVQGDIRSIGRLCPAGWADYVTANPPYLRADCGGRNADFVKYAAFHEHFGDIDDFARAAAYLLGTGGVFYTVYRPDRLARLLTALSAAGLEPKRLRPSLPTPAARPLWCWSSLSGARPRGWCTKRTSCFTATRRIRSIRRNWRGFIMHFLELLLIALALGTDAFAVTLANGLAFSGDRLGKRMAMPLTFGLFQGIMPLLGYCTVRLFSFDFSEYADLLMFVIFAFLGGRMLWDYLRARKDGAEAPPVRMGVGWLLIQAFGTSVDAFAVGFVLAAEGSGIVVPVLVISAVTVAMCTVAVLLGRALSTKIGERGEVIGAVLLLALAVKALVEALAGR